MKGEMPSAIFGTAMFLIVLSIIDLLMIFFMILNSIPFFDSRINYSVNFMTLASKPFSMAEILGYTKIGDRQLFEQAIETMEAGSLENARALEIPTGLRTFVSSYKSSQYKIAVRTNIRELMSIDNAGERCGENSAGWCMSKQPGCDVGYVEIDDENACKYNFICCKLDTNRYLTEGNNRGKYSVVSCGSNGICSEGETVTQWISTGTFIPYPLRIGPICSVGQFAMSDQEVCKNTNDGKTKVCCAEVTETVTGNIPITKATVPLLYREKVGYLEVEIE